MTRSCLSCSRPSGGIQVCDEKCLEEFFRESRSYSHCAYPGCHRPLEYRTSPYCGELHTIHECKDLRLFNNCILCYEHPSAGDDVFCGKQCAQFATEHAPMILPLSLHDPRTDKIRNQFHESWRHNKRDHPEPTVQKVYKIIQSKELMDDYSAYRNSVEWDGVFSRKGMTSGNERRRWHGTRRSCTLGDVNDETTLCSAIDCGVCGIIRTSFRLSKVATANGGRTWERYGRGIYTSSTSSKSHDYAKSHQIASSKYLSMLLTTVVVGRGYKTEVNGETLHKPPPGYHSVLGEVGSELNYDETVVYDEDAIRPAYLVIYDRET